MCLVSLRDGVPANLLNFSFARYYRRVKKMAGVLLSPTVMSKIKTKESANRIKHGSPKLQEVLRQRCRQRMKEKRGQLFNRGRLGLEQPTENVHDTLTEIVRQEFSDLATTDWAHDVDIPSEVTQDASGIDGDMQFESELIAEEEQWILEEYERLTRNEEEMFALLIEDAMQGEAVFCPICQKGLLTEIADCIICRNCGLNLPARYSVSDLGRILKENVDAHSSVCNEPSSFVVLPENNNISLYLMCSTCSVISLIV